MADDHQIFVGPNNSHFSRTASARNDRRARLVALVVELNTKELQTVANPLTNRRGMLANSAGEDQRIHAAQDSAERTDILSRHVAKKIDGVRSALIRRFLFEQISHVRTCF